MGHTNNDSPISLEFSWKFLLPSEVVASVMSQHNTLLMCLCDIIVNTPAALAVIWKDSTYNYAQYVILDNDDDDEQLLWFMHLLYYTFIFVLECTYFLKKTVQ